MESQRALAGLAAVLALAITDAAQAAAAPGVRVAGGTVGNARMCGTEHEGVRTVAAGAPASAVVPGAKRAATRAARRGSRVVVERCEGASWKAERTVALGARRRALTVTLGSRSADLRIRTRTRDGRLGTPAYVRVGGGEVVDVPVQFKVVNRNTTLIPCLGAPDGRTYTVRGTLVAPRAALDAKEPAATLYLHGLGYGGWFFRFQDVPGYDYARQQADAGHASIVLDRLGNPNDDQLANGLATCFSSQADMADQVIRAMRVAGYDAPDDVRTGFDRVVLAGHSAGGFIAQVTQYSFDSADALAVIGFTDIPSPLTLATFATAGGDCLLAPQRSHGRTGAPNYVPFGRTDADFAAGHFFDIDPEVRRIALAKHNLDPCGDLLNALQALLFDQLGTRSIKAPVLVVSGADDALFAPPTNRLQALLSYIQAERTELVELPSTGHAVTLGRTHEQFRQAMDRWLTAVGA
ncbi:alpha/beta fold hydrolase [Conexibacter sp. SYSU D00693]|uniref:alpha/beta fold hydrolase n=1 Tax=Conexibacter sp. SYSU D00693 TaxID=2812560 RepID=UPI001F121F1D|nr:alpha/beta hydrolase [Conexibacter sp. SYSU D00693]